KPFRPAHPEKIVTTGFLRSEAPFEVRQRARIVFHGLLHYLLWLPESNGYPLFFILKSFHVMGGGRPMFLRELKLPPPVSHHVISVRPAWRVCDRPPAEILQSLRMLRWQRMVRQEDAAVVHHVGDAAHCQRLLKKI